MIMRQIRQIIYNLIRKETVSEMDETGMNATREKADDRERAEGIIASTGNSDAEGRMRDMSAAQPALDRKNFERIVSESLSGGQKTGCLIVCNVDRCKEINDIYGRDTGDAVLRNVEDVLRGVFGSSTCIGSPGGDVFTLWLPVVSRRNADDIRRQIGIVNDRLLHPAGDLPPVSVSAGAAFCRVGEDSKGIHSRAYKMLYLVKASGRCGCEMSL